MAKQSTGKVAPAPVPQLQEIRAIREDMKRGTSFPVQNLAITEETLTHYGYHPDEWKQCYNRITNKTFWMHYDRGTISYHDPKCLRPDSTDPDLTLAFDKAFKKKVVLTEIEVQEARVRELELAHENNECCRCFYCAFIFGCPCLWCLEAVLDSKTAKKQCQTVFPPIKGKLSEQSFTGIILVCCCMPCYCSANGCPGF